MLGSCAESDIAVRVLTRVIGHYPAQNMLLIDLGWTGCSAQGAEFGYGVLAGHPELKVVQLKQEAVSIRRLRNRTGASCMNHVYTAVHPPELSLSPTATLRRSITAREMNLVIDMAARCCV